MSSDGILPNPTLESADDASCSSAASISLNNSKNTETSNEASGPKTGKANLKAKNANSNSANLAPKKQQQQQKRPHTTVVHERIAFMSQAADILRSAHLSEAGCTNDFASAVPGHKALKRRSTTEAVSPDALATDCTRIMTEMREKTQTKLSVDFKRQFCRVCKTRLLLSDPAPASSKRPTCRVSLKRRAGANIPFLAVKCTKCSHVKHYLCDSGHGADKS